MACQYLLDTNIVSYLLKEQIPVLKARFGSKAPGATAVSSVTEAEVRFGVARRPGAIWLRLAVDAFIAGIPILPWDSDCANVYGVLRAEQQRIGRPLSIEDLMIASHALSLGLTLVTHDAAFSFVDGLKTEDWTVA
jgi:tRNA(fMet)-specific endonuclease VapC